MDTVITMVMSIPLIIFFMYAVILSETHKRFCIRVNQRIAHDCQLMSAWSSQDLNQNLYRIQTLYQFTVHNPIIIHVASFQVTFYNVLRLLVAYVTGRLFAFVVAKWVIDESLTILF